MAVEAVPHPPGDRELRRLCAETGLHRGIRAAGSLAALPPVTVLWVRLGASEHLLRTTTQHLGSRRVGERLLLHDPVVKTQVAHAVCEQLVVEAELCELADAPDRTPPDETTLGRLHRAVTDVDRLLLRLLGGRSFLSDGPGADAMLSESLCDLAVAPSRDGAPG